VRENADASRGLLTKSNQGDYWRSIEKVKTVIAGKGRWQGWEHHQQRVLGKEKKRLIKKKMPLSIGIIVDPMGVLDVTPEEEIKEIERQLARHLGDSYKLNFHKTFDCGLGDLLLKQLDILVVDYGGLLPGATGLIDSVMRAVRKYLEEHPSCTLVLWSQCTKDYYMDSVYSEEGVIGDSIEEGENILVYKNPLEKFWKKLKAIFND